jgi:hypothetical protein
VVPGWELVESRGSIYGQCLWTALFCRVLGRERVRSIRKCKLNDPCTGAGSLLLEWSGRRVVKDAGEKRNF